MVGRGVEAFFIDPEPSRGVALWIQIDKKCCFPRQGKSGS
jgi:hypothetical protein